MENQGALLHPLSTGKPRALRLACARLIWTIALSAVFCLAIGLHLPSGARAQGNAPIIDLRRQALAGEPGAMARYGRAMALGEGISKNPEQALDWLRRAAERGNVQGMYWYATMLYSGEGGPPNQGLAVSWLKRAADSGHVSSMFTLSQALADGQGTARDIALAYTWASIVAASAPLQNPEATALKEFKQRVLSAQQILGKSLSSEARSEAQQQAANWAPGTAIVLKVRPAPVQGNESERAKTSAGASRGSSSPPSPTTASPSISAPVTSPPLTPPNDLPPAPTSTPGFGLPPAPVPVPGDDNPLNRRPANVDPTRRQETFGQGDAIQRAAAPGQSQQAAASGGAVSPSTMRRISSGTAFFVTPQGALLTNHHLVKNCTEIRIVDGAQVKLMAMDVQEDLALLIGPPLGRAVNFRASDQVSQGEDVLAYGFPLQSVLATSGQIGSGLVSATNGLRNNPSQLQIDVPLQSGNSGGPLLDRQGQLVGMTVSKLNALQVARVTGDIPQNVNFAIKHSVIKRFLDAQRLQYQQTNLRTRLEANTVANEARTYTVALECLA